MTVGEAEKMVRDYYKISNPNEEQDFQLIEALSFIIDQTKYPHAMMELGGWYYGRRRFDLAAKISKLDRKGSFTQITMGIYLVDF